MKKQKIKIKVKTNRGAAKRFKITGSGKVRFRSANRAHINTKRSTKQTRHARTHGVLCPADAKLAHRLMQTEGK